MRRLTRTIATPLALGGLLLLGACSGDDAPSDDPTATQPADDETTAPEDDKDVAAGGAECLEGDWAADLGAIEETLLSNPVFAEADPEVEVSGDAVITFKDGDMTSVYEDNRVLLTMALQEQEFITETVMNGTTTATYTVADDILTVSDVDFTKVDVQSTTTINGEKIDTPDMEDVESFGVDLGGDSAFECTADELRLTPQVEGGEAFVQVLTRR